MASLLLLKVFSPLKCHKRGPTFGTKYSPGHIKRYTLQKWLASFCHLILLHFSANTIPKTNCINTWWVAEIGTTFPHPVGKRHVYGQTGSCNVNNHCCDCFDITAFYNFPPLRRRENYVSKKKEKGKEKRKAPTCGQLWSRQARTPFHLRGFYSTPSPGQQ